MRQIDTTEGVAMTLTFKTRVKLNREDTPRASFDNARAMLVKAYGLQEGDSVQLSTDRNVSPKYLMATVIVHGPRQGTKYTIS